MGVDPNIAIPGNEIRKYPMPLSMSVGFESNACSYNQQFFLDNSIQRGKVQ